MVAKSLEAELSTCRSRFEADVARAQGRRDAMIQRARDAGLSDYRIAQLTGYSREYVSKIGAVPAGSEASP